ncbi:MAG TPA: M20/M25/M40 family metallo-hydrolase [Chitinophagaceae bacterium]|nr:M20/M25/M40 family metallo-hydrolase [Chitinophagaceae bacterium]
MKHASIFFFLIIAGVANGQKLKREDKLLLTNLQQHVQYLADDKLEGRRTGTKGEALAVAYISQQFKTIGLAPKGTEGYSQPFEVMDGRQINEGTHLTVDGKQLLLETDFFPLVYSPNIRLEALPSRALQEAEMPWFWNLKETLEDATGNPHFDIDETIKAKATEVQKRGATALFVYNTSAINDGIAFNSKDRSDLLSIPVVYLTKKAIESYFNDESATLDINLAIDMGIKKRWGTNVVGFIDNGAPATVVLGAHFDHLGWGEDGNSLQRGAEAQIHNGADDNASGTAALLELARLLKKSKAKKSNYLFIAFSGEELGLLGSKYFTEHPTISLAQINYMVNMDMLGRLNEAETITVGGIGTSPAWTPLFAATGKSKVYTGPVHFRFDSSGTGPSDHSSFYLKGIPVLFYFTGLHADYHRPSDDWNKLNYAGEVQIVKHIYSLVEATNVNPGKLPFTKTREQQLGTSARFSVTLGIMPDYAFSGNGLRVDAVSENRPAQKAGLLAGDVITGLGEHAVSSIESYMQALARFKKGDTTTVSFTRGAEKQTSTVTFE